MEQRRALNLQHLVSLTSKRSQKNVLPFYSQRKVKSTSLYYASLFLREIRMITILHKPFLGKEERDDGGDSEWTSIFDLGWYFGPSLFLSIESSSSGLSISVKFDAIMYSGISISIYHRKLFSLNEVWVPPCTEILIRGPPRCITNQECSYLLPYAEKRILRISCRDTYSLPSTS